MPESWVRGAILIRMNSLIRGHSGVRLELIQQMGHLLREHITPLVPLRGSISSSGGKPRDVMSALRYFSHTPLMFRSRSALLHRRYLDRKPFDPHNLSIHFLQNLPDHPLKQGARSTQHRANLPSVQGASRDPKRNSFLRICCVFSSQRCRPSRVARANPHRYGRRGSSWNPRLL